MLGISRSDTYNQYLAYHEGQGGFKRKSYNKKPWLIKVAKKVERRANDYKAQLVRCEDDLVGPIEEEEVAPNLVERPSEISSTSG